MSSDRCTQQPARPPTPGPRPARPPAPGPPPARTPADSHRADPRRAVGRQGEELAAAHLARLGFALLARNVRTRHGEIDLIAFDGAVLVFAEVKTRRRHRRCPRLDPAHEPLAGLRPRQRARLRRLAVAWLSEQTPDRPRARTIRFDAVGVTVDEQGGLLRLDHLEAAW